MTIRFFRYSEINEDNWPQACWGVKLFPRKWPSLQKNEPFMAEAAPWQLSVFVANPRSCFEERKKVFPYK